MPQTTKSTNKNLRRLMYMWTLLVVVILIVLSTVTYLYIKPEELQYSTTETLTALSTRRSITAQVSGQFVALRAFTGRGLGYYTMSNAPTLTRFSSNGIKDISMEITLMQGDVATESHNDVLTVHLTKPLQPGKYRVIMTVVLWSQMHNGPFPTETYSNSFIVQ